MPDTALWNPADLEARLCRVLELAGQALAFFGVEGFTDEESPVYNFGPEKVIAETAMLAYAAAPSAASSREVRARVDALLRQLAPLARSERALVAIALQPALAPKFALPHVLLTWMGHADMECDDFIRACVRSTVGNGHDRSPTGTAECAWLGLRANSDATQPAYALLDTPLNVFEGLREDAYAFTHLVLYGTDFGRRARGLGRRTPRVLDMAEALLARYLDVEDYDLTGEILLGWPMTRTPWSPIAAFAFRVLARVEATVGLLPCGNVDTTRLQRLSGDARTRYALAMAYHTAYVMGFACAAALGSGRTPPRPVRATAVGHAALDDVCQYLDDDKSHWQTDFVTLPRDERLALTPFVFAVTLTRKSRDRDYDTVVDLLRLAQRHRLTDTIVCKQAVALVGRLARCATALRSIGKSTTKSTATMRLVPEQRVQNGKATAARGRQAPSALRDDVRTSSPRSA